MVHQILVTGLKSGNKNKFNNSNSIIEYFVTITDNFHKTMMISIIKIKKRELDGLKKFLVAELL